MNGHAIYKGTTQHIRHTPKKHRFSYRICLVWLDLQALQHLSFKEQGISSRSWTPFQFRRSDYLGDPEIPLHQAVLHKMNALSAEVLKGEVFFLGQIRCIGLYFSPVNFYYLRSDNGSFTHMLAEVSNTPWNERHYYLVDLRTEDAHHKQFHVSPFNPMDLQYQWKVSQPEECLKLNISCIKQGRHFDAGIDLKKQVLTCKRLFKEMIFSASLPLLTLVSIYWQALKLYRKGVPLFNHPTREKA